VFRAAVAVDHSHAGDALPVRGRRQLGHILAADDRHVFNRLEAPSDMALQEWPARHIQTECFVIEGKFAGLEHLVAAIGQVKL